MELLLQSIRDAFTLVARPSDDELTVHGLACSLCRYLLEDLQPEQEMKLSEVGVRLLLGELSLLSAKGFQWVLPSYLEAVVDGDTELGMFLAFHFGLMVTDSESERQSFQARLDSLSESQVSVILQVLFYLRDELNENYAELDSAITFLEAKRTLQ